MTQSRGTPPRSLPPRDFNVHELQDVVLDGPPELMRRDWMSPFVWSEPDGRSGIMVRGVPRRDAEQTDTGKIWAGWSADGRRFEMLDAPVIVPGPSAEEAGGIEDPTVLRRHDGTYVVYYTGVSGDLTHGQMFYATGPSIDRLAKRGIALASSKAEGNVKEATVMCTADHQWRLFYEYAEGDASRIGLAFGPGDAGPWEERPTPMTMRADGWDNWHLSTGPMLLDELEWPVMFYNGATVDARWRIGWVVFDHTCLRVVGRGLEPLVVPPPPTDRNARDIAFAASVTWNDDAIWLYYSIEDCKLARARIVRS